MVVECWYLPFAMIVECWYPPFSSMIYFAKLYYFSWLRFFYSHSFTDVRRDDS